MIQMLVSVVGMVLVFLLLFEMFGGVTSLILKMKSGIIKNMVLGFFVYFSLLQFVALPMILTKQTLTMLSRIWLVVLLLVTVAFLLLLFWKRKDMGITVAGKGKPGIYVLMMIAFIGFVCYFVAVQNYWGWDTAFYIGNINTSLYTDTMYQFDGGSGFPRRTIDLRYALSTFYMNSAIFCKWTGMTAVYMQKHVVALICVLLNASVLWMIGEAVFENHTQKKAMFTTVALGLNFFFISEFTTSQFFLMRSYEAKAFCGSVVIPSLFYGMVSLWKQEDKKEVWKYMFLVMLASIPVSMSSLLIVPILFFVGMLTETIVSKDIKILRNSMVCLLPNVIYLVVYFLYSQGILIIKV